MVHWTRSDLFGTVAEPNTRGGLIGGQLGYNYQIGALVLGAEASWDWSGQKGDTLCPNLINRCHGDVTDLFLATARLGFTTGNTLVYAKGGYANGSIKAYGTPPGAGDFSFEGRRDGWAWGAGTEYKLTSSTSLAIDWTHVDLSTAKYDGGLNGPLETRAQLDAVTLRINFNFGAREEYRPLK